MTVSNLQHNRTEGGVTPVVPHTIVLKVSVIL